ARRAPGGPLMAAVEAGTAATAAPPEPVQIALAPHESLLRAALRRFRRHRLAMVGTVIVGVMVAIAIIGPLFLPDPYFTDILTGKPPAAPSVYHFLGTATSGRDVLPRVALASGRRSSSASAPSPCTS